uniref:Rhophilin-2-like n=1 Tax=Phallusia mammillata TaxID=59560 RepID=A0A6F9DRI5_9ASCI|nr:rhophilin-2-like [Phallusia mammillata]
MEILRPSNGTPSPRKGCNPVLSTQRSKMQSQRTVINQQLCKQMRLRNGAENLYNASSNQKVKDTVALELSFVNSNLQLLKEELSELNSSVEPYQNRSGKAVSIPMIPLGLKDTKELEFMQTFEGFISSHYGEDPDKYSDEMADFADLRNSIRTPARTQEGVDLLLEYYHQIQHVENRFLPPHRPLSVYFHWYDCITGVPAVQRSVSLEKASILFNIGALYSQLGTRADRTRRKGINIAIDAFQSSAGAFDFVRSNFVNAPTTDLSTSVLQSLTLLMLAQAQECVLERKVLGGFEIQLGKCASISQEAMKVSEKYSAADKAFSLSEVKSYVPYSWINMAQVKRHHYRALAHYYAGLGLLEQHEAAEPLEISKLLSNLYLNEKYSEDHPKHDDVAQRKEDRRRLGKSHLRQSVFYHERALQTHSLCKMLRTVDILKEYLQHAHNRSVAKFAEVDTEEDFFEIIGAPDIQPYTEYESDMIAPSFSSVPSSDIFHRLGPVSIFSAHNRLGPVRLVKLSTQEEKCSFTLQGDGPVIVSNLDDVAMQLGIRNNDVLVAVDDVDAKWSDHDQVANEITEKPSVELKLISVLGSFAPPAISANESMQPNPNRNQNNNNSNNGAVVRRRQLPNKSREIKKRHSFGIFTGLRLKTKANVSNRFSTISENPAGIQEVGAGARRPPHSVSVQRSATSAKYVYGQGTVLRPKKDPYSYRSQC